MGIPTRGETYVQLLEHLIKAQECCAMMSHLHNTEDAHMDKLLARGWLGIAELLRQMQHKITLMAQGRLQ